MPKRLFALPVVLLLLSGAAEPQMIPRFDSYEAADFGITINANQPFTLRMLDDRAPRHQWRVTGPDVVLIQRSVFQMEPDPEGGVGFSAGEEITLKISRPGAHTLKVEFVDVETGERYYYYSPKVIAVTVR